MDARRPPSNVPPGHPGDPLGSLLGWFHRDARGAVVAFSRRVPGLEGDPYGMANLGTHVGDDPDRVRSHRRRLARQVRSLAGVPDPAHGPAQYMDQVHGDTVAVLRSPADFIDGDLPATDAVVSDVPGGMLAVMVADCVPVVLQDAAAGVHGVAHAGRAGVVSDIVSRTVEAMRSLGSRAPVAWVGPCICAACYEIPADLAERCWARVPAARALTRSGTSAFDLRSAVRAQLEVLGVEQRHVDPCTFEDPSWFSYRRDGVTGRFAGVSLLGGAAPAPAARG